MSGAPFAWSAQPEPWVAHLIGAAGAPARDAPVRAALVNAFGFGGQNCALVLCAPV